MAASVPGGLCSATEPRRPRPGPATQHRARYVL